MAALDIWQYGGYELRGPLSLSVKQVKMQIPWITTIMNWVLSVIAHLFNLISV